MKRIRYILSGAFIIVACQPTLIAEFEDKPVVCCYLDAGASPILTVSKLIAFRDDVDYSDEDINTLTITITDETEEKNYPLQAIGEGRYESLQLIAKVGHSYKLTFVYNGNHISATTTVPEAPQGVEFSATSIGVMGFSTAIEITWSNDDRNFYIVEGFTTSSSPVRDTDSTPAKGFKLDYTQGSSATLSQMQFNYLGNYEVSLIRIWPEYAVMSQGSFDTSTSLVDIKGNIEGGYGIFTGINRVMRNINVYRQSTPF